MVIGGVCLCLRRLVMAMVHQQVYINKCTRLLWSSLSLVALLVHDSAPSCSLLCRSVACGQVVEEAPDAPQTLSDGTAGVRSQRSTPNLRT